MCSLIVNSGQERHDQIKINFQARRKQLQIGGAHINFGGGGGGTHNFFFFFFFFIFFFFGGGGAYLCKLLGGARPPVPPLFLRPLILAATNLYFDF